MQKEPIIINHYVQGSDKNRETLFRIARKAIQAGKATGEDFSRMPFKYILEKSFSQASFIQVVDEQIEGIYNFRKSQTNNRFNSLVYKVTPAYLAEEIAKAYLSGYPDEEASLILSEIVSEEGNQIYRDIIYGVSWEYQKWALDITRKKGFRNWEKHKDLIKEFISKKIGFKDLNIPKIKSHGNSEQIKAGKLSGYDFINTDPERYIYLGFICKPHITESMLGMFHLRLKEAGYIRQFNPQPSFYKGKRSSSSQVPYTWLKGNGRLVYLFTRLFEYAFELPEDMELPENALIIESNLKGNDQKLKTAQSKTFSRWLNGVLIDKFRNAEGESFTREQLVEGKKTILDQDDNAEWKVELEEILQTFPSR